MHLKIIIFLLIPFLLLSNNQKKSSYKKECGEFIGHLIWKQNSNTLYEESLDIEDIINGLREASKGKNPVIDIETFIKNTKELEEENFETTASQNLEESNNFFESISSQQDVNKLIPGKLYFIEILKSDKDIIQRCQKGRFKVKATYMNGKTYFDNTQSMSGTVIDTRTSITGFQLGVCGMGVGGKRKIFIHPEYAYGKLQHFDPNVSIIVEVELLENLSQKSKTIN